MPTLSYELFAYLEFLRQSSDSFILSLQVLKQCKLLDPAPSFGAVTKLLKCLPEITEPRCRPRRCFFCLPGDAFGDAGTRGLAAAHGRVVGLNTGTYQSFNLICSPISNLP